MAIESLIDLESMERCRKNIDKDILEFENKITNLETKLKTKSKMLDDNIMADADVLIKELRKVVNSLKQSAKTFSDKLDQGIKLGKDVEKGIR